MSRTAHKLLSASGGKAYEIDQSLICSQPDASKLRRTPTSAGNRKTWTFSTWCKRSRLGLGGSSGTGSNWNLLMGAYAGSASDNSHYWQFGFSHDDELTCGGWVNNFRVTNRLFRDTSAWYHLVLQIDTTQATASNRTKIFVNGVQETSFSTTYDPAQNFDLAINNTVAQSISDVAYDAGSGPYHFDGYIAETHLFDGAVVAPSEFGETDSVTGQWIPKEYTGTASYGTNGYYLDFVNNTENGITAAASTFTAPFGGTASNATADDGNYIITNTTTGAAFDLWHVDLGSAKHVVSILQHNMKFTGGTSTFKVYSSNDNQAGLTNWTERAAFSVSSSYQDLNTSQGVAARYWKMRATAFGVNGEGHVDFVNLTIGGIGADASGQGNDYTPTNLANADVVLDTPTNNFCTYNRLDNGSTVLSQGDLKFVNSSGNSDTGCTMQIPFTGKWYWEIRATAVDAMYYGITRTSYTGTDGSYGSDGRTILYDGTFWNGSSAVSYGSSYSNGDIVNVAFDCDNSKLYFGKNGTWFNSGNPATGSNPAGSVTASEAWIPNMYGNSGTQNDVNFGQNGTFNGLVTAQGNTDAAGVGNFYYAPPSGFKALCTKNFPTPAVKKSSEHFNTVLYVGNDTTNNITGVGFQPDLVWLKNRSQSSDHMLHDAVRGADNGIRSNSNVVESDQSANFTGFASDGFSLAASSNRYNDNSENYVSWNWKAGGSGSANTDGSINTTATSVNTTAGISISNYQGTGSNATVGHGLGVAPKTMWIKNRDTDDNWRIYFGDNTDYMAFNWTGGDTDDNTVWNDTSPTSTVFSIGTDTNTNRSGDDFIAYCFAEVEGFSKFGTYEGNNNANGPFVHTGFTPAWIVFKYLDNDDESWWLIDSTRDSANPNTLNLFVNLTGADYDAGGVDILSNGFKPRATNGGLNGYTGTFFYLAFADFPFKYANAR